MLHITNGSAAVDVMHAAGLPGAFLPWDDVLHEGPVPAGLPLERLSAVRADFIAGLGWGTQAMVRRRFAERDRALGLEVGQHGDSKLTPANIAENRRRIAEHRAEWLQQVKGDFAWGLIASVSLRHGDLACLVQAGEPVHRANATVPDDHGRHEGEDGVADDGRPAGGRGVELAEAVAVGLLAFGEVEGDARDEGEEEERGPERGVARPASPQRRPLPADRSDDGG